MFPVLFDFQLMPAIMLFEFVDDFALDLSFESEMLAVLTPINNEKNNKDKIGIFISLNINTYNYAWLL